MKCKDCGKESPPNTLYALKNYHRVNIGWYCLLCHPRPKEISPEVKDLVNKILEARSQN